MVEIGYKPTNKKNKTMTKTDVREAYHVVFLCDIPMPSTLTVAARDADHAKELATVELKNHRNVEILDVYRLKDAPDIEEMLKEHDEVPAPAEMKKVN